MIYIYNEIVLFCSFKNCSLACIVFSEFFLITDNLKKKKNKTKRATVHLQLFSFTFYSNIVLDVVITAFFRKSTFSIFSQHTNCVIFFLSAFEIQFYFDIVSVKTRKIVIFFIVPNPFDFQYLFIEKIATYNSGPPTSGISYFVFFFDIFSLIGTNNNRFSYGS